MQEAFDSEPMQARSGGDGPRKDKVRLLSLDDLDGRTRAAQKVRDTRNDIFRDLGGEDGLSTLERCVVNNVALIDAMIADVAARWLLGEPLDVASIATLQNTFNRSAAALGWQRRPTDVTPDLKSYVSGKSR